MVTITVQSNKIIPSGEVAGDITLSYASPAVVAPPVVMTIDDKTLLAFLQRMVNVTQWTPTITTPSGVVDNPITFYQPGILATNGYWTGEAIVESKRVVAKANADAKAAAVAAHAGNGIIGVTQ